MEWCKVGETALVFFITALILFLSWLFYFIKHENILTRKEYFCGSLGVAIIITVAYVFGHYGLLTNYFNDSAVFSVITSIGIGGTILGIYFAVRQTKDATAQTKIIADLQKLAENKIEDYKSFYKAAIEVLNHKDREYLHFSGPTLLPGHALFDNEEYTSKDGKYSKALMTFAGFLKDESLGQERTKIILPIDIGLLYNDFKTSTKIKNLISRGANKINFDNLLGALHYILHDLAAKSLIATAETESPFLNSFYLSTGGIMLYAVTFNEYEKKDSNSVSDDIPNIIIGLKTDNRFIVKEFERRFLEQWKIYQENDQILNAYNENHPFFSTLKQKTKP
ncbi:MAG: hypothetical protein LBU70_07190 [Chitinispirillales bacterium]|nr:hypothetical protein [Chitinispirillales bacterium]